MSSPSSKRRTGRTSARSSSAKKPSRKPAPRHWGWLGVLLKLALVGAVALGLYMAYLDAVIRDQFEGKRWSLPAHVYARPLELYPGMHLGAKDLEAELLALGYRATASLSGTGSFARRGDGVQIATRGFTFWDGKEPPRQLRASFKGGTLAGLQALDAATGLGLVRLEPLRIGGIYPRQREDRVLVQLAEVPPLLTQALLAVEDRRFYRHHGISLRDIGRAMWANLRAGGVVEGGSTLTQQLVKNYFLTSERSLWRKAREALMAILLELHYSKDEILEAYLNEVFLGQDGQRAIHGFGLASYFYFARPLSELGNPEMALLVALVRGPSYYNPRRHPERAKERRDRVLDQLLAQGVLSAAVVTKAKQALLGVTADPPGGTSDYPAFMDLVRRQLQRDYRDEDLTTEGLRIFTTLDPRAQRIAEQALAGRVERLEKRRGLPSGSLEGSVVITSSEAAEVLALVGGRRARFEGFNRALDAVRQVGSLIKPAIYVTALASRRYTLATPLADSSFSIKTADGKAWSPQNYDHQSHGEVALITALAQSYNLATARLGLSLGVPQVVDTLNKLGVERPLQAYPSLLLGAAALTPIEVTQVYQSLAAGGFRTPLRSIREVLTAEGKPLARYPLAVEQVLKPADAYLISRALQEVVRSGTGRSLAGPLRGLSPAGKTGTTNDLRDSWFAGYTGDYLAVVWVGRDDNQSCRLSGAAGAMQVWGDIMQRIGPQALRLVQPPDVEFVWVDAQGRRADSYCEGAMQLPFVLGTVPQRLSPCVEEPEPVAAPQPGSKPVNEVLDWIRGLMR